MTALMMLRHPYLLVATLVALAVSVPVARGEPALRDPDTATEAQLSQEVYRQLMDLPFFTVFDDLQYRINGTEVTLYGQTANPTLKIDAQNFVRSIPGVTKVNNEIELLPESPFDDSIRRAEFRAIYREPSLQKYGEGSYPSIHIIVKNGHVMLVGTVDNEADKQLAGTRALQVRNAFSVENDLNVKPTS